MGEFMLAMLYMLDIYLFRNNANFKCNIPSLAFLNGRESEVSRNPETDDADRIGSKRVE